MVRLQPVLPLFKTNLTRRRSRPWHLFLLVIFFFLTLTFVAVRYLPSVIIDPVSVLKSGDFKEIFVPPIPHPPVNWSHQDHNHFLHLSDDQSRLKEKINQNKDNLLNLDEIIDKDKVNKKSSEKDLLPVTNLTETFAGMSIEQLKQLQSNEMRREKVREVKFEFLLYEIFRDSSLERVLCSLTCDQRNELSFGSMR